MIILKLIINVSILLQFFILVVLIQPFDKEMVLICIYTKKGDGRLFHVIRVFVHGFLSLVKKYFEVLYVTNCKQIIMKNHVSESFHPES